MAEARRCLGLEPLEFDPEAEAVAEAEAEAAPTPAGRRLRRSAA